MRDLRQEDVTIVVIVAILCMICLCAYAATVFDVFQQNNNQEIQNPNTAVDLKANFYENPCNFDFLGVYEFESYGKIELFCENGMYFGENPDFSIALTEKTSRPAEGVAFNAVFCMDGTCYAHPVTIFDGALQDMYGKYVSAEKMK
jgi:hypothetical protein